MKKICLLLVCLFSLVSVYGSEGITVSPDCIEKSFRLSGLLGSVTKLEEDMYECYKNPEYLSELVESELSKNNIECTEEMKNTYKQLAFFSTITFGYNPVFADHVFDSEMHPFSIDRKTASFGNIHQHYIDQGTQFVSDMFNYYKITNYSKNNNESEYCRGDLYFVVPNYINKDYSLSVIIDNEQYSPLLIHDDGSDSMFLVDKQIEDLRENQEIKLVFCDKTREVDNKVELTYQVTPIDKSIFEEAVTALDRMDKSIKEENPHLIYAFGKYLHDTNFKYGITDLKQESDKIGTKLIKKDKRSGVVLSEEELDSLVEAELNKVETKDIEMLTYIYENISLDFIKSDNDFVFSKFAIYGEFIFLVSLNSSFHPIIN